MPDDALAPVSIKAKGLKLFNNGFGFLLPKSNASPISIYYTLYNIYNRLSNYFGG
jgi:hypothetical protein